MSIAFRCLFWAWWYFHSPWKAAGSTRSRDISSLLTFVPGGIAGAVDFGANRQPFAVGGGGNELHDNFVADERFTPPVLADEGEEPVFDRVPLAGPPRQVGHFDCQPGGVGQC